MITEDFVSFETAKLLKEKGFDVPCLACWYIGSEIHEKFSESPFNYNEAKNCRFDWLSRPTLQMAMKWLREEKGIAIVPILSSVLDNERFLWDIEITVAKTNESYHQGWIYESYERICEVAIKYCLENLI